MFSTCNPSKVRGLRHSRTSENPPLTQRATRAHSVVTLFAELGRWWDRDTPTPPGCRKNLKLAMCAVHTAHSRPLCVQHEPGAILETIRRWRARKSEHTSGGGDEFGMHNGSTPETQPAHTSLPWRRGLKTAETAHTGLAHSCRHLSHASNAPCHTLVLCPPELHLVSQPCGIFDDEVKTKLLLIPLIT